MDSKWFVRSRELWTVAIPVLLVVLPMLGISTDGLQDALVNFGNQAELTVQGLLLLATSALVIWRKFRPDDRPKTLLPKPLAGGGASLWLWLFLLAPLWSSAIAVLYVTVRA